MNIDSSDDSDPINMNILLNFLNFAHKNNCINLIRTVIKIC